VLDVVIRNGEVIDGTGAARRRADVGIEGGRVVVVGPVDAPAAVTIDATGKLVAPGFIDVHTHFDAQVFWDAALTPSPLHGVTTAIAGNCGFTVAPLSGDTRETDYILRMLARVEGMPAETLRAGVPWDWTTTAEYFDRVEAAGIGINLGFMVGHSAIRRVVMREHAGRRTATPEELEHMKRLLRVGLDAGGLGFSTSDNIAHNDGDGNMVPSRSADSAELLSLAAIAREFEGTGIELFPRTELGPTFSDEMMELMADLSVAAQRPLNWNILQVNQDNLEGCERLLAAGDAARAKGGKVIALTIPMSFPVRFSFATGFLLEAHLGWESAMKGGREEKMRLLADKDARAYLNAMAVSPENKLRGLADWASHLVYDVVAPENEQYRGQSLGKIAHDQGRDPWDVLCEIVVADELNTSFGPPAPAESDEDWRARLLVWRDPRAVIGASDAGAHFDTVAMAHYPTVVLQRAVREKGIVSFEEAIHLMTQVPADLYGLRERGRLQAGCYADVVVIDPGTVGATEATTRFDLPGGMGRLCADSTGIAHVLVNGRPIVDEGRLTGSKPGRLLRSGRDTMTPSLA
jgi:N-acyl-D-aspartate/D-glutamate deacylase